MKILFFETVSNKRDILAAFLRSRMIVVDETNDPEEAFELVKFYDYDAVLMRLTEGRPAELELIRKLRVARVRAPLIAVAQSMNEASRLRVLQAGADDLMVDALSHEEIFIKMQNLIRRSRGFQDSTLRLGHVEINMNAKKIYANGKPVTLTKKEYQIAEILALRKGVVLSKEAILDHLYGGMDEPNPKIIDVFVCKIRKKLQNLGVEDFIETNWGRGYMVVDRGAEVMYNNGLSMPPSAQMNRVVA